MDGVEAFEDNSGRSLLFLIRNLSDELKELIRSNLAAICHGQGTVAISSDVFSYKNTLKDFFERYDPKHEDTKKGMIGELLTHILLLHFKPKLLPASPFFNMEEKSVKKGFDVILYEEEEKRLWITEVKSGKRTDASSKAKNKDLLNLAKRDLLERLNDNNSALWKNAIHGAMAAASEKNKIKETVQQILAIGFGKARDSQASSSEQNAILSSVMYGDFSDLLASKDVSEAYVEFKKENKFKELILLSFQKETFERVEQFLRNEMAP